MEDLANAKGQLSISDLRRIGAEWQENQQQAPQSTPFSAGLQGYRGQ